MTTVAIALAIGYPAIATGTLLHTIARTHYGAMLASDLSHPRATVAFVRVVGHVIGILLAPLVYVSVIAARIGHALRGRRTQD